mgnify:CR=1 FL=1
MCHDKINQFSLPTNVFAALGFHADTQLWKVKASKQWVEAQVRNEYRFIILMIMHFGYSAIATFCMFSLIWFQINQQWHSVISYILKFVESPAQNKFTSKWRYSLILTFIVQHRLNPKAWQYFASLLGWERIPQDGWILLWFHSSFNHLYETTR